MQDPIVEDIIERIIKKLKIVDYSSIILVLIIEKNPRELKLLLEDDFHNFKYSIKTHHFNYSIKGGNYSIFELLFLYKENLDLSFHNNYLVYEAYNKQLFDIVDLLISDPNIQKKAYDMKDSNILPIIRKKKIKKFLSEIK